MIIHKLVQPCLDMEASPNQGISIIRGRLHSIPSVRLSEKHFPLSNYPIRKSCFVCAYEKISAGKYKKQKHQTSVKNIMFMSPKTVLSDGIPIVN